MANLNGFDATTVDPNVGFDPIPVGKYLAVVTDSVMKATKAGTGEYLELTFEFNFPAILNRQHLRHLRVRQATIKLVAILTHQVTPNKLTECFIGFGYAQW